MFFPPASLDAVLEGGGSLCEAAAGVARQDSGPGGAGAAAGGGGSGKGWRGNFYKISSMPASVGTDGGDGNGDDGDGMIRSRRRRWSFAGQGRFGAAGSGGGGNKTRQQLAQTVSFGGVRWYDLWWR